MYKSTLSPRKEIFIHIVLWLVTLLYSAISIKDGQLYFDEISVFDSTWLIVYACTFYFNYIYVLPRVFHTFTWGKAFLGFCSSYLFFTFFRYFLEQHITLLLFEQQNYFPNTPFSSYVVDNLFFSLKPIGISVILWIVIRLIRVLEQNKYVIEEQKNMEIKFLKAQINPHFIFNTLNNIYSMVYFQSPKALSAIEKLSNIMRFTSYETNKTEIDLMDEINYIKSYIELEELRHQDATIVQMKINTDETRIKIPPYIFSPLVENALKHGDLSAETPIEIILEKDENTLKFNIKNKIGIRKKDKLGGIGLENLRNRLGILFPQKYQLDISHQGDNFSATIEIQLT